jgi:hypothetical protein
MTHRWLLTRCAARCRDPYRHALRAVTVSHGVAGQFSSLHFLNSTRPSDDNWEEDYGDADEPDDQAIIECGKDIQEEERLTDVNSMEIIWLEIYVLRREDTGLRSSG